MIKPQQFLLNNARNLANSNKQKELLGACQEIIDQYGNDSGTLLDVATLYQNFGYITYARECNERARALLPDDLRPFVNLANLARDAGHHAEAEKRYDELLVKLPDNPVIRRNALISQEYNPLASDADRLQQAQEWGEWGISKAGGQLARPPLYTLHGRALCVGYVSADLCQHTVGLFLKNVLNAHDPAKVKAFTYSAGSVRDWVTDEIRQATSFRDVATLNDGDLARLIRQDKIDILIDLSGHTAGSRLTVFAHRPAPVLVSWLGYFATTGLSYMDAVLLDNWHAPTKIKNQFVEPIIRLPTGRFCYQPVPWVASDLPPLPCLKNGFITFGCFNNTAKLNDGVFDVWAKILLFVPASRLVLKWRTLVDEPLCDSIRSAFADRGVEPERIELRPASFHADMLNEYADIDIALDPFPFTGGLTSCEALWMGVPVVTWPQSRVVSRQTFAILSTIGLPELAAKNEQDYIRIVTMLAADRDRLSALRNSLRAMMQTSPLMDVADFTHQLESTLHKLYTTISKREKNNVKKSKSILHVGPGHRDSGARLPDAFQTSEWHEIRLDIELENEPDILGSMLDMSAVKDKSIDAIYSAHNIEHVYAYEVPIVLAEFLRVLKPDGFAVITCPDLQSVCALVVEDKLTDAAYSSQAGAITPLDIIYGHGDALEHGHFYMAHKCGFTEKTLTKTLLDAGFRSIAGMRRLSGLDLWMLACKSQMQESAIRELAGRVLPSLGSKGSGSLVDLE